MHMFKGSFIPDNAVVSGTLSFKSAFKYSMYCFLKSQSKTLPNFI